MSEQHKKLTASHWGIGLATVEGNRVVAVEGHPSDPAASEINDNIPGSLHGKARIRRPAVRKSWLAGARITDEVQRGCVFLWTGA